MTTVPNFDFSSDTTENPNSFSSLVTNTDVAPNSTKDLENLVITNATDFANLVKTNNKSEKLESFILGDEFNVENINRRLDTSNLKLDEEERAKFDAIFTDNLGQIKK